MRSAEEIYGYRHGDYDYCGCGQTMPSYRDECWRCRQRAQGIEARSAKTEGLGPQDESPVTKSCAQGEPA